MKLKFAQTLGEVKEKNQFTDKLTKSRKKNPHFSTQVTFWKCCAFICSIFPFFEVFGQNIISGV